MDILEQLNIDPDVSVAPDKLLSDVRILVADKDDSVLALYKQTINQIGWKAAYVNSVTKILDAINSQCGSSGSCYDAIISGVNFFSEDGPRLTGITAARQIRKVHPEIPIIFVTSYLSSMVKEEARRLQAEVFPKTSSATDVMRRVAQLVYWNRLANLEYKGAERRERSVNFGMEKRRATDQLVTIPKSLALSIESVIRSNYAKR